MRNNKSHAEILSEFLASGPEIEHYPIEEIERLPLEIIVDRLRGLGVDLSTQITQTAPVSDSSHVANVAFGSPFRETDTPVDFEHAPLSDIEELLIHQGIDHLPGLRSLSHAISQMTQTAEQASEARAERYNSAATRRILQVRIWRKRCKLAMTMIVGTLGIAAVLALAMFRTDQPVSSTRSARPSDASAVNHPIAATEVLPRMYTPVESASNNKLSYIINTTIDSHMEITFTFIDGRWAYIFSEVTGVGQFWPNMNMDEESFFAGNLLGTTLEVEAVGGIREDSFVNAISLIPEPSSWGVLCIGSLALASFARRRRKKRRHESLP